MSHTDVLACDEIPWPHYCTHPSDSVTFFALGTPRPKGSKDYKGRRRNGSAILVESANVRPWQTDVAIHARLAGAKFTGPVEVHITFVVRRPKTISHNMAGLGRGAGDGDKLERAVWDGLVEAGMIEDDSRVVRWSGWKRLAEPGEPTGAYVTVRGTRT